MNEKKKVLIVDDDPDILDVLDLTLGDEDYDLLSADSGAKAVEIALDKKPDLIVMDWMMPGLDGFLTLDEITRHKVETRVIILSGKQMNIDSLVRSLKFGACDYLEKPFDPGELIKLIQLHLDSENVTNFKIKEHSPVVAKLISKLEELNNKNRSLKKNIKKTHKLNLDKLVVSKVLFLMLSFGVCYIMKILNLLSESYFFISFVILFIVLLVTDIKKVSMSLKELWHFSIEAKDDRN